MAGHLNPLRRHYMTYSGSMTDVSILAHELGQGFHHCVMRDLPDAQRHYGRSVAETASIFGETVVRLRNIRLSECHGHCVG
ncbi:MAG: M3 family metallopeptidase [Gammaproteobacteria bacterium]|nr:M3 family metallopeptidase [Gammaproteobacteria bacterium]